MMEADMMVMSIEHEAMLSNLSDVSLKSDLAYDLATAGLFRGCK